MPRPCPTPSDLLALTDQCVLCGLCLPHCPTYAMDALEAESPRGRIMQTRELARNERLAEPAAVSDKARQHIDQCLGCRACERVCPANVEYGQILVGARALLAQDRPALRQKLLNRLLSNPALLRLALRGAGWGRGLLPAQLRVPALPSTPPLRGNASVGEASRGRIALFTGCVARQFEAPLHAALLRLLTALGWDVVVLADAACCGALALHAGDARGAHTMHSRNGAALERLGKVDAVLTCASGCHESVATALSTRAPVHDVFDFLDSQSGWDQLVLRPLSRRVALHLPCTQRNVLRNGDRVLALLRRIPQLHIELLPDGGCCGAAGSHMIDFPERAAHFREPLLLAWRQSGADTLCTTNIGCRLHLQMGDPALEGRIRHPVELLVEALP